MNNQVWTPEEYELAKKLRWSGLTWSQIGERLGRSEKSIRRHIGASKKEPRPRKEYFFRATYRATKAREYAPLAVLEEREFAMSRELTIGQELLGEPLPGRSALERKP